MSFTVYRSSAGSGKTFTLVREYLKIVLLEPRNFRHILAITFTNKAAAEMKERVLHALRQLSITPPPVDSKIAGSLLDQLMHETGLNEVEIADRSSRCLRLILHNYSDFTIGTIDSFSHRVIRSFAHDFGLPVQFNIELDATEILTTAVDLLLERVGTDEELTQFLVKFLEVRMDEDKGWNIEKTLVSFAKVLLDEEGQDHIAELRSLTLGDFTRIADVIRGRIGGFEKLVRKVGEEALGVIAAAGVDPVSFYRGNQGICKYFEYLATGRFDRLQPNSYVKTTVEEDKWYGSKATPDEKGRIDSVKPRLQDLFQESSELLVQSSETYMLNKLLAKTIFPMAVLNEIDRMMTEFKKQSNIIHISEFNRRISAVVMKEPVPFIYERLGERYHHLMIDEFQDTSRLQWQNFIPLIENALASGYFNLVVGDGKQAIYRFRNGDVSQFARLPQLEESDRNAIVRQRQQVLESHFSEKQLDRNFRSKQEIVEFNNRFFTWINTLLDEQGQSVYRGLFQEFQPEKKSGYIEIKILDRDDGGNSFEELNYKEIVKILQDVEADGYSPRDIAILCRNNRQASGIARMLIGQGVDVVSSESLLLIQSPEVNFLVACIRFLFEQPNPIHQAELAGYLFQSGKITGTSWPEILKKITDTGRSGNGLVSLLNEQGWNFNREELLTLPLYDLCENLIRLFTLNQKANAYLQFFLDAILTFVKQDIHGAGDFLEWWDIHKMKLSVIVPEGMDAVRTMTIHKSKGLQFPVVIFPFATEFKMLTKGHLWTNLREQNIPGMTTALLKTEAAMEKTVFKEQYLEEDRKSMLDLINLLYVVLTRPEDRLYILTSKPPVKQEAMRSLPAFFAGFLENEGRWQPGELVYRFGLPSRNERISQLRTSKPLELNQFISEDWRHKIRIRSRAPQLWDMENPLGKIHFGNHVHNLLSKINTSADAETAIAGAVMSGMISREELPAVKKMLSAIFTHKVIGPLYTSQVQVKTEPGILLPDGNIFRPDRVVFYEGNPVIVEYKTGVKNNNHVSQIERYADLLLLMGYSGVKKYLVYLHEELEVIDLG